MPEAVQTEAVEEETPAEEEDEGGMHEELGELLQQTTDMSSRYALIARRTRESEEPVKQSDIADLYEVVSGDVLALVSDLILANNAALFDLLNEINSEDGDGDGGDDDDDVIDEDTIQIYSTLKKNAATYLALVESPGLSEEAIQGFQQLIELNHSSMKIFQDQFGEEIEKAYEETVKQAEELRDGAEEKTPEGT